MMKISFSSPTKYFADRWDEFEDLLTAPLSLSEFSSFITDYRGMAPKNYSLSRNVHEFSVSFLERLFLFLEDILNTCHLAEFSEDTLNLREDFEANLNLALVYWFGNNDRNCQWRTLVHFLNLAGQERITAERDGRKYGIILSEFGITLGVMPPVRLPFRKPISQVLLYNRGEYLHPNQYSLKKLFAHLRTLQREICFMIDEWEYQNSILAVEFSMLQRQNELPYHENLIAQFLNYMDAVRNAMAIWCLQTFVDVQNWICLISVKDTDIMDEVDALAKLLLSAVQKIYLPASVSRLKYQFEVAQLFLSFAQSRIEYCPEDFTAKLMQQCLKLVLGGNFDESLFEIFDQKPFQWKMSFDPSSALRAFCWAYSQEEHVILSSFMAYCYFKKSYKNQIDESMFFDLCCTYEMQQDFLSYLTIPIKKKKLTVQKNLIEKMYQSVFPIFESYQSFHEEDEEGRQIILESLNKLRGNL